MQQTTNGAPPRNTGAKLVEAGKATRFKKGDDPRRNLNGRPRSFDAARTLAQEIVHQELPQSGLTVIEAIFRQWAKDPKHQRDLVEYAFGKVPDKLETTGLENKPVVFLHYAHERQNTGQN